MEIRPQPGPQLEAARCNADIMVVGGSAGVGKSWLQAYLAARYHRTPGWAAIMFRRTQPMLIGGGSLHSETEKLYPLLNAVGRQRPLEWVWPDVPSIVELRHLQHEKSAGEHKSKAYTYIGLDEASDFTGPQFNLLSSRLRTLSGVKTQMVLTTNPDPDCYLREWLDWWIAEDGYPDPTRAGKLRFYVRVKDEIVWADTREELLKYVGGNRHAVMSFTFIPGTIRDNKVLMDADPGYLAKLMNLPDVERERFLGGNWNIRETAGSYFQQNLFKLWGGTEDERGLLGQTGSPAKVVQSVRAWDFASTPVQGDLVPGIPRPADFKARDKAMHDPDWTCSVRLDRVANGRVIVADVTFHRDTPGAIEELVERTAQFDGPNTVVALRTDPGQAGVSQTERLRDRIIRHTRVEILEQTKAKEMYAREPSRACYRGEIYYKKADWNLKFFGHLEAFPEKGRHDDAVDAFSGAYLYLQNNGIPYTDYESADRPRIINALPPSFTRKLSDVDAARQNGVRIIQGSRGFGRRDW